MSEKLFEQHDLYKSPEILGSEFKERLNHILFDPLTVENIEHFADNALDNTVSLAEDILHEYQTNPYIEKDLALDTQQQEDIACEQLGLPNIADILERIIEVQKKINDIKKYLILSKEKSDTIITPPNQLVHQDVIPGGGVYEEKKLIPRLLTLIYILEMDFGIDTKDKASVQILEGEVTDNMMRKTPYVRVTIPDLNRAVYVCDEEGNASYVFDTEKLQESRIPLDDLDIDGKKDKNSLIVTHPSIGVRVVQTPNWRNKMKTYLEGELPEQKLSTEFDDLTIPEYAPQSEFVDRRKKEWLSFDQLQEEIKSFYDGSSDITGWYRSERKNHKNWPARPDTIYEDTGWKNWKNLIGKESKEFLSFEDFKSQVKVLYPGNTGIEKWYHKERKTHPDWPSQPEVTYAEEGFSGYPELVGKENRLKIEYIDFTTFIDEVRLAYKIAKEPTNIQQWYKNEIQLHKKWPSAPHKKYQNEGWIGYAEMVGKENPNKKEFLDFNSFRDEVIKEWERLKEKPKSISHWFYSEQKKHKNWPSSPHSVYREEWLGFPEIIKHNFLELETLSDQAKSLYLGKGSFRNWYRKEQKFHSDWPQFPERHYDGWKSWSVFAGKKERFTKIPLDEFKKEVLDLWREDGSPERVMEWYKNRYEEEVWPASPLSIYENDGLESVRELVGLERIHNKDFLSLEELRQEILRLYDGKTNIKDWYYKERIKHKNWPSQPRQYFEGDGWTKWSDLVVK